MTPFYNPRIRSWGEHFVIQDGVIHPLTAEGRVTVKILRFNDAERVSERSKLAAVGLYLE